MRSTADRRCKILLILCERRTETIGNLSFELSVDRSTIQRDIEILSASFPLYTTKGTGGGVHIVDGFRFGMRYLTDKQYELLERLLETLEGADKEVLDTIIKTFKKPIDHIERIISSYQSGIFVDSLSIDKSCVAPNIASFSFRETLLAFFDLIWVNASSHAKPLQLNK